MALNHYIRRYGCLEIKSPLACFQCSHWQMDRFDRNILIGNGFVGEWKKKIGLCTVPHFVRSPERINDAAHFLNYFSILVVTLMWICVQNTKLCIKLESFELVFQSKPQKPKVPFCFPALCALCLTLLLDVSNSVLVILIEKHNAFGINKS